MRLTTLLRRGRRVAIVAIVVIAFRFAGGAVIALAAGDSPSALVVFGDSLSDVGNIAQATFGVVPGSAYFNNRFSNGPVWAETLAVDLGVGPLRRSTAGGNDFAYGGAQTIGTGGISGVSIRDVDEQVTQYLSSRTVDPAALYVVWAGANDLLNGQTNLSVPTSRLATDVGRLLAAGARQFLVPNLPLLGKTPRYNDDPALAAQFDLRSEHFNAALEARIETLAATNPAATFYRLDVAGIFSGVIADPAVAGLVNVVDPAAPGLSAGALFYNTSQIVPNPNEYLFWDDVHPTAPVHALLAQYARRLLAGLPGDADTDGQVDAADLALWQAGFGAAAARLRQGDFSGDQNVDGADLLVWQRALGNDLDSPPGFLATIAAPEPEGVLLVVWGALGVRRGRRRVA